MVTKKKQVSVSLPLELMEGVVDAIKRCNMRITPSMYVRHAVEDSVQAHISEHEAKIIMDNGEYLIRLLEREGNKNLAEILRRYLLKTYSTPIGRFRLY